MFLLIVFILAVAALAFYISKQPDEFSVSRSVLFSAPPEAIFPHVNDLHKWEAWSPWAKLDPTAKNSFAGAASGTGASMSWEGNNKVGSGSMTITESRPSDLVRFRLDFLKPMKGTNMAEFRFVRDGAQTRVTWSMQGKNNWMGKVMSLLINCEKMVGAQFDKGLASLKAVAEG